MRMLHHRSAAACFLIWALFLFISLHLMRRFWIRHIFPVFSVSIWRLHPSQISSRVVHTSLDCMRAELHCCDGKHLGWFDEKKFGSLTVTLNRIGSFVSNGFSLLQYLFSRVVLHQIPNESILIR